MSHAWTIVGTPSGAGACGVGQDQALGALREAGLLDALQQAGADVEDLGDSPVIPWRPDRAMPQARNLAAVADAVQSTTARTADALDNSDLRRVLVLGGDCTVGIGTIAGALHALGDVTVVYFDLHYDLNTPTTAADGALDWMGLAHMLGTDGTEPGLTDAAGPNPLLTPDQVVLFGQSPRHATRFERSEVERLGLAHTPLESVRTDREGTAREVLRSAEARADPYLIHLDVDVVDLSDAPIGAPIPQRRSETRRVALRAERACLRQWTRRHHANRTQPTQRRSRLRPPRTLHH